MMRNFGIPPGQSLSLVCKFESLNSLTINLKAPKKKPGEFVTGIIRIIDQGPKKVIEKVGNFSGLNIKQSIQLDLAIKTGQLIPEILKRVNDTEELKEIAALTDIHLRDNTLIIDGKVS